MDAASQYPVTVIPGMELCTIEEVHVLCLFKQLDAAMAFDDYVYKHLIKIKNRPDIFGFQQIYNSEDAIAGEEPYLLINATDISFDNVWQLTADYGGIMIPRPCGQRLYQSFIKPGAHSSGQPFSLCRDKKQGCSFGTAKKASLSGTMSSYF